MTEVETELDSRFDDVDVDSILARCERRGPLTFTRKRILYQAPEFVKRLPATETVEEGSNVTFGCKVVGFPKPEITWYKDDDVINDESRAKIESDESGAHSIHISDVSKCDSGTYKIRATNLEGSSTSSLYITVKAKSKLRSKKKHKRKGRAVACAPLFPAIIELVAEENKETLEIELQPESPLTPIYCTISRKTPVMWPAFLGDWAYSNEELLQKFELDDLEVGCEDVFEVEPVVLSLQSQTFVNTASTEQWAKERENTQCSVNESPSSVRKGQKSSDVSRHIGCDVMTNSDVSDGITSHVLDSKCENCIVNGCVSNSDVNAKRKCANCDLVRQSSPTDITNNNTMENKTNLNNSSQCETENSSSLDKRPKTLCFGEPETISVNRSYARGNSTFSVAKRSPSPFSSSRKHITQGSSSNGSTYLCRHQSCDNNTSSYDTSTLQNLNNERILNRMRQNTKRCAWLWDKFAGFVKDVNFNDNLLEVVLFICGSTFLALWFDIKPSSFVFEIVLVMLVKLVFSYFIQNS